MADTKHWGGGTIPDSHLTPFDTTLPRPRPYTPDSAEKREPPPQRQSSPASGETLTAPTSVAWFHSVALYPDADLDQDGFVGHTVIEWDADTPSPELLVHVLIYGRDSYGQITLVGQTVDYTIYGTDPDLYWTEVFVRWQSQWDLRLELQDSWGNTLEILDFGSAPVSGPALPMNVSLEPGQVDAVFVNVTYDPPGQTGGTDWNNNGYSSGTTLLFKIQVLYDSTYTLVAEVYATDADSAGHEICI